MTATKNDIFRDGLTVEEVNRLLADYRERRASLEARTQEAHTEALRSLTEGPGDVPETWALFEEYDRLWSAVCDTRPAVDAPWVGGDTLAPGYKNVWVRV